MPRIDATRDLTTDPPAGAGTVLPPLPRHLQLEITSACNLRCQMCLVRYRPPINKIDGAMPLPLFQKIVDGLPELEKLTLQGLGEPLLSPYLLDMVAYAKAHGVRVGFNSNATLLTRRIADRLVDLGLDWLHVSIDGASAPTYEGIREGASFRKVAEHLTGLAAARRAAGRPLPWIRAVFVAMRRNVTELPDLVREIAGWGVDELRVQNLAHSFDDTDPTGRYAEIRAFTASEALWGPGDDVAVGAAFDAARRVAGAVGVRLRLPEVSPRPGVRPVGEAGCSWPWDAAYVTSQGLVQPCCMVMGDDRVCLGDLTEAGFAEIWWGPAYREFRRALLGSEPPSVCAGCSVYRGTF